MHWKTMMRMMNGYPSPNTEDLANNRCFAVQNFGTSCETRPTFQNEACVARRRVSCWSKLASFFCVSVSKYTSFESLNPKNLCVTTTSRFSLGRTPRVRKRRAQVLARNVRGASRRSSVDSQLQKNLRRDSFHGYT